MVPTTRTQRTQYEASWTHGPISGPLNGFLGAVVLAGAGRVAHLPAWAPAALAVAGIAAAIAVGSARRTPRASIAYRVTCWAVAGGWTTWTILFGWSVAGVVGLVLAVVLAGLVAPAFAPRDEVVAGGGEQLDAGRGQEGEWAALIAKVCGLRQMPTVRKLTDWPKRTGQTFEVEFAVGTPDDWTTLRDAQVGLAAARRLPPGCPVRAERSPRHQGAALLHVATVNDMAREIPFPTDYSARSIVDEFSIGAYLDKRETMVELYQSAGIVAGQRGGGKTVILQDMNGQLHRCVDAVIWHVDLNGGGMSSAWLTPYALGQIDRPTVDWVACSPAEAILMARAGNAIAKDRKRRYQRLMIERNTDILPVSANLPAIVVIVDEGGEVTGEDAGSDARQAAAELRELQRIGRAMCVNVVFSVQRATADYVPSQMKKAAALSIITRVKDQAEIAHLLDWKRGLNSDDLMYPGCAYIQRNSDVVAMFRAFRLLPAQIADIARATVHLRPTLDPAAQAVGGDVYANRWQRAELREFLAGLAGADATPAPMTAEPAPRPVPRAVQGAMALVERADELLAMTRQRAPEPGPDAAAAVHPLPDPRAYMVELVTEAGADGMATADIIAALVAAGVHVVRQTVQDWLRAETIAGRLFSPRHGQWVAASHAAAA